MDRTESGKTVQEVTSRQSKLIQAGRAIVFVAFMSALAPGVANAQGGPTILEFPVAAAFPSPCIAGEVVSLSGRFVTAFYLRLTHATTRTIIKMDGTNLDPLNPKKYVSNDEDLFEMNMVGATETTREVNSVLVRQAEAPGTINLGGFGDDFKMKTKFHFTTNANGTPTASVDSITFSCM